MPAVFVSVDRSGAPTIVGHFYYQLYGTTTAIEVALPSGVTSEDVRPCFARYKEATYVSGTFSEVLVFDKDLALTVAGLPAPTAPVLTTQSTGITAEVIGYMAFRYKLGDGTVQAESDLGDASNTLTLTNQGVHWASIPATCSNPKATHVALYRSVDGSDPRHVADVTIGTTTYDENVATLDLGAELAGVGSRGVPIASRFIETYHNRLWYANQADTGWRLYYSELDDPEAVGELNWFDTLDGDVITAVHKVGEELIVQTKYATYLLSGYTEDDFAFHKITPSIGCISHFSCVIIHNRMWFASQEGVYLYDAGGFRYLMKDIRDFWRDDYLANLATFEDSIALNDPFWRTYKLLIIRPTVAAPTAMTATLLSEPGDLTDMGDPDEAYYYRVIFRCALGQTAAGADTADPGIVVTDHTVAGKVSLTDIPLAPDIGPVYEWVRDIYRNAAGGGTYLYAGTIGDNVTTEWVDNVADADLGDPYPDQPGFGTSTLPRSFYYVSQYDGFDPELAGDDAQPDWIFDVRAREDEAIGLLAENNDSLRDGLHVGGCDGKIRKENAQDDPDDDGDTYQKRLTIRHGAQGFSDFGGDLAHGKKFEQVDSFLETEDQDAEITMWGGDEEAFGAFPDFQNTVPASGDPNYAPEGTHHFKPTSLTGRLLTKEIQILAPVGVQYRGYQVAWTEGPARRAARSGMMP